MEKKPISRAGFDALLKELKDLKENQRPEILKNSSVGPFPGGFV